MYSSRYSYPRQRPHAARFGDSYCPYCVACQYANSATLHWARTPLSTSLMYRMWSQLGIQCNALLRAIKTSNQALQVAHLTCWTILSRTGIRGKFDFRPNEHNNTIQYIAKQILFNALVPFSYRRILGFPLRPQICIFSLAVAQTLQTKGHIQLSQILWMWCCPFLILQNAVRLRFRSRNSVKTSPVLASSSAI